MLTAARDHYYRGPNVWRPWSGALLKVDGSIEPERLSRALATADAVMRGLLVQPHPAEVLRSGPDATLLFLPCDDELCFPLLRAAVAAALGGAGAARERVLREARALAVKASLPAATLEIVRAAARRDIPFVRIDPDQPFVQLGHGTRAQRVAQSATSMGGLVGSALPGRPSVSMALMEAVGLPARRLHPCATLDALHALAQQIGMPLRIARADRTRAAEFIVVRDAAALEAAFAEADGPRAGVVAGPLPSATSWWLLAIGGRVVAALDPAAHADVLASVHPRNAQLAERVARLLQLEIAAVEVAMPDITQPWHASTCTIETVSPAPELMHFMLAAPEGRVADAFLSRMFASGETGRVPTVGITGSVGKTTTSTIVAAILADAGHSVALSTTQGAWIGDELLGIGDVAGGRMAQRMLLDPAVDAGVFECARGGLLKQGLVLDGIDVGAVLNVLDQHVGFDGAETRDDLAEVKGLVAQHARRAVALNADDPLCLAMRGRVTAPRILLVSLREDNDAVRAHIAAGGTAAWLAQGEMVLCTGTEEAGRLAVSQVPSTWDGRFRPGVWHALFAMAVTHALGVPLETIARALRQFQSTPETNPGRMNMYEHLPYRLLVSHASGPEGMEELVRFVADLEVAGRKHLVFALAGNRTDEYIRRVARFAAEGGFDRYICSDWTPLRGRPPREVALLLAEGLREAGVDEARIVVADSLDDAVQLAYGGVQAGDLLVENTFTDASKPGWSQARGLG